MNNRKRTRGRKFHYQTVEAKPGPKTVQARKEDRGMVLHKTIKHLERTNPQTGEPIFRREGKGTVVKYSSRFGFEPPKRYRTVRNQHY